MSPRLKLVIAVLGFLLLAALAYGGWYFSRAGEAPNRVEMGSAQPFALADCKARLFDGAPAIAVMFTQPLARSQDWGKLITAAEGDTKDNAKPLEARWVLGDNPRVLYLPYVTPDRTYRIELAAGIAAAAGGGNLATAQSCTAKSEAMPASFYFASRGVVLPAGQNGGLPVVTVNTPEVDVQFLRIEASALPGFLEQVGGQRERMPSQGEEGSEEYEGGYGDEGDRKLKGTVSGGQLDQLRETSASVYLGRFATDARSNRRNVSILPVEKIKELQEPGIYVAVMNPPGRFG